MGCPENAVALAADAASVTTWNVCCSNIEPTRLFLRRKETIFDSANGGLLRKFLHAFNHASSCVPFRIVLVQTDDGSHLLKVVSPGSAMNVLRGAEQLSMESLAEGVQLGHGDCVRVYYKLADAEEFAGPFAFEYLTREEPECETVELADESVSPREEERLKKPPLNLLQLPAEMLIMILSQVPSSDVFYRVSAVCQALNQTVQNGVPFKRFKIETFTQEEKNALGGIIDSAQPIATSIEGVMLEPNGEPTRGSLLFVHRLTERAEYLQLNISGMQMYPPDLQLNELLPAACIKRLKLLAITGNYVIFDQYGYCFEELEQLWLSWTCSFWGFRYKIEPFFAPHKELIFPKLKSVGLWGQSVDHVMNRDEQILAEWTRQVCAVPFERVQLYCSGLDVRIFSLFTRGAKTLKMECHWVDVEKYCKVLKTMTHLENVAVFLSDFPRQLDGPGVESPRLSVSLAVKELQLSSVQFLQLRLPTLSAERLKVILLGCPMLKYLYVRFLEVSDRVDEGVVKELTDNSLSLRGVGFEEGTEGGSVMRNELVDERLRKTEDFWKKKIWSVFGPLDCLRC